MHKIINLTPHEVVEVTTGRRFPPSGTVARVGVEYLPCEEIDGIPTVNAFYGDVEGLPAPTFEPIFYIVSGMVLDALGYRRGDLLAPAELIRDSKGQPIGCKGFRRS